MVFEFMFTIVFVLVIGTFIVTAMKGITQWNKNNNSPRLTVPVTVISKRTNVSHHHHGTTNAHHTSTTYYVTFQVESGDRMELHLTAIPPIPPPMAIIFFSSTILETTIVTGNTWTNIFYLINH